MASVVEICNLALSNIRAGSINNLNEGSLQAQLCKLHYPIARDQVLREIPWQFAHKLAPLAALTDADKIFNWEYAFQYPSDCLKLNRLVINYESRADNNGAFTRYQYRDDYLESLHPNLNAQVPYRIYGKVIASNDPELRADYVARIEDPNQYDAQFISALSNLLASKIAIGIVGGNDGRQYKADALQIYQLEIATAAAANANEQYLYVQDSDLVTIRD